MGLTFNNKSHLAVSQRVRTFAKLMRYIKNMYIENTIEYNKIFIKNYKRLTITEK